MSITMKWGQLTLGSVLAFAVGWFLFGLLGAIALAVVVCLVMGILVVK
ncbi:MAG: hypothetical protein JXB14_06570 [Candidatus Altiarchaeota archaeon]|nr:hypothetical protein [Candidatus Altiarchaeota archaeon]